MARLPAGYRTLFDRAVEGLQADDRVRGMWLSRSLARGAADAASDLDVLVAVADDDHEAFAGEWRGWLSAITPTVLAEELWFARGSFGSVTPDFERFDVVVEKVSQLPSTLFRQRLTVFDHDGLDATVPDVVPAAPSATVVAKTIEEWFHFSAMPEVLVVRRDWLLAAEHLHLLRSLVFKLCVERNQPLPMMGVKQWSSRLTPEQIALMEALPTAVRDVPSLIEAHLACARTFLSISRPLAAELGVECRVDWEAAPARHLSAVLEIDDPYPTGVAPL